MDKYSISKKILMNNANVVCGLASGVFYHD